jgi:hypothetical protein
VIISFIEHLASIIHQYSTLIILHKQHRASWCTLRSTVFQHLTIVTQIRSSRSTLSILIHIISNNHIYLRSTEHKWIYQSTELVAYLRVDFLHMELRASHAVQLWILCEVSLNVLCGSSAQLLDHSKEHHLVFKTWPTALVGSCLP